MHQSVFWYAVQCPFAEPLRRSPVSAVLFLQNDGCGRCCHADDHCREKNVGCGRCGLVFVINVLYYVDAHSVPALFRGGSGDDLYCVLSGSDPDYVGLVEPVGIALAPALLAVRGDEPAVNIYFYVGVSVFVSVAEADLDPACIYLSRYIESLAV